MSKEIIYNPFSRQEKYLWLEYPSLRKYAFDRDPNDYLMEWQFEELLMDGKWTKTDLDNLLRMVVYYIDKSSPVSRMSDVERRKKLTITSIINDAKSKGVTPILSLESTSVKHFIKEGVLFKRFVTSYFKIINDITYETWLSLCQNYANTLELIRSADAIKEASSLNAIERALTTLDSKRRMIQELELELFDDPLLKSIINESIEDKNAGYAEKYAIEYGSDKDSDREKIFSKFN